MATTDTSTWTCTYNGLGDIVHHTKPTKKKGKKMKIHWNEKEGQIMTKDGKCLYDKENSNIKLEYLNQLGCRISKLETGDGFLLGKAEKESATLRTQIQCAAKGHDWVYDGPKLCIQPMSFLIQPVPAEVYGYVFTCSLCGLEITKTKKELKPAEREELKRLGVK